MTYLLMDKILTFKIMQFILYNIWNSVRLFAILSNKWSSALIPHAATQLIEYSVIKWLVRHNIICQYLLILHLLR
jgi:hypothetical protein